jgi:acyl-CoA synthetase (AMP-forming)/AMP-acid ligase II
MQILSHEVTLINLIGDRAQNNPDQTAFIFLKDGETAETRLTYGELDRQARAIAAHLSQWATMGDRVMLVYPYDAGLEFIAAFVGCLYAGLVAVPCHPPRNRNGVEDLLGRLVSSESRYLLTTKPLQSRLHSQFDKHIASGEGQWAVPSLEWIATETIAAEDGCDWQRSPIHRESLAFLQYTSGSTGFPKGVMITHDCLLHNQKLLQLAFGHTEQSVGVGWLPLFHDMGLIGNVLQALYLGTSCILMSPVAFIQKPIRWLQAISRYRATTSGGPNFAYDLLCRYVTDEQLQSLDLSSWEVAFTGAEPVRAETLEQFAARFAPCGFRREAFYPCYGMAEATLFITGGHKSKPPKLVHVSDAALAENRVEWLSSSTPNSRTLVGCGHSWLDSQIAIAHPETGQRCAPDQIGEIWVAGSGLGRGYWQQLEATERTFQAYLADSGEGPFLRTGDLGFVRDGELFITGRLHDVLVFWGLNHYPEHLERTVADCHPAFRANSAVAFAAPVDGRDRLFIAQEVDRQYRNRLTADDVVESIRWALFDQHFVDVYGILLLKPGGIPKTSSGKLQRRTCREMYLNGELEILSEWRSPTPAADIPFLIRRYLNPMTHLKRYWRHWQWIATLNLRT